MAFPGKSLVDFFLTGVFIFQSLFVFLTSQQFASVCALFGIHEDIYDFLALARFDRRWIKFPRIFIELKAEATRQEVVKDGDLKSSGHNFACTRLRRRSNRQILRGMSRHNIIHKFGNNI